MCVTSRRSLALTLTLALSDVLVSLLVAVKILAVLPCYCCTEEMAVEQSSGLPPWGYLYLNLPRELEGSNKKDVRAWV